MKRVERDVVALFNTLWYRDFPLSEAHKQTGSRTEWTIHIGICIRSIADLLGYFTHFEEGQRTDAIIKDNSGDIVANIEWEWYQPFRENVNEIQKLYSARTETKMSIFIGYSRVDHHEMNIRKISENWDCSDKVLLAFLVTYKQNRKSRKFIDLKTYLVRAGSVKEIRSQPALPWEVKGTRWENAKTPVQTI